ncbi:MAG TPA: carboxypeptidase-like regulatory domain-containing protein [Terriglobales bacterium]|nr:carboxypeptidase-like regulatory domain-containing protein [Terriglobales bacterium]
MKLHPSLSRCLSFCLVTIAVPILLISSTPGQSTSGRILGRVADPTGAVLADVTITLTNQATGVSRTGQTNSSGDYNFVEVQPGTYTVTFEETGFKKNVQKDIIVNVNQVVNLNSTLQIGQTQEVVEVTSEAPQVDTTSTQLGAVINNRSVNELPLNTRDTYQFLQLQPGVQAQLGNGNGSLFYGSQDTGSVSVNGGRTRANNFSVNGGDANDQFVNLPTVQPTPDSVEEFRVITNAFDAEYGRNSGSVVNVITKSGANNFHGDIYEYFRNTVLDAQGYFNTIRPQWNQNQYGGTFGGPIKKDRTFFFTSYEGRRVRQGIPSDVVNVPTLAERDGDFSGVGGFAGGGGITTPDIFVANVLDGRPGCDGALGVASIAGLPTQPNPAGGTYIPWSEVFPSGVIPTACQDPVAANLMQRFIPEANVGASQNQSVPVSTDNADQFTVRFDHKITDRQNFTAYYYFNDLRQIQPFAEFEQAGANLPGFGNLNNNRFQQWNLSHTWSVTNAVVNEARFTYMREGQLGFLKPQNTGPVTSSCTGAAAAFCFTGTSDSAPINTLLANSGIPAGKGGITPGLPPTLTGVPFVNVSGGASIGNNWEGQLPQVGNSFQWSDNLTWVKGNHTFKFGADIRRARFDQYYYFDVNGEFTFNNSGPNAIVPGDGDNYAEFLLGVVDTYTQGSGQREDIRGTSVYPFAQDSWKIKPNITLNYGLRWELNTPPTDISGHVETFRPGQNSSVYPCQLSALSISYFQSFGVANPNCTNTGVMPTGLVVPGDKGVPAGMTSTYYKAFAPRVGLAYSPNFDSGFLGKLFGNNGKTSIRTGWGLFYNPIEELVMAQFGAEPPFGGSSSIFDTFFNTPFVYQAGTTPAPNPFNGIITPTPGHPVDSSLFRPILLYGEFQPHLRTQYTAQYNLTIQRELARDLMLQVGYVGSQGHRLLASHDINYSNPQTCLDLMNIAAANPNDLLTAPLASGGIQTTCGPTVEDSPFFIPGGTVLPNALHLPYAQSNSVIPAGTTIGPNGITLVGLRPYSSPTCNPLTGAGCPVDGIPVFSDIFAEDTIATSSYNALEAMLEKRFSHGLQFQAAYTFSKSMDEGSTFEETLNPVNYRASRALSLFNSAQRFVISYDWELPIAKHEGFTGKVVNDWAVSGITQFQTGFPIRLDTQDDTELINSLFFLGTEAPQRVAPFQILNPKTNGNFWFNPNDFQDPPLGQFNIGTQRSICCGPALQEWDFAVHKKIPITEDKYFQFRGEIFNLFNHTNFYNPDGHFSDGPTLFGRIQQAQDPRLVQFALKFFF